ncbi:MAG: phage baseplate assembly protein V, partial [Oscillospiraceae bacterium]
MSSIADLLDSDGTFGRDNVFSGIGGFIQGTVSDNGNKDFCGMVKVEFTAWKSAKNICEWIPLLRGYAGGAYGCYAVPEVGDLVLVGFIGAGMKRPFVLGSLFPADAKMQSESFIDKNTNKRLKTKGGIELLLSDEQDKQAASVTTPKGLTITLGDEKETVTISDQKGENILKVDSKNGTITLTAKQKIVLKAGKCELSMDGQGGAVRIKC